MSNIRTYLIEGPKTDYLFWIEAVLGPDPDSVFYQVDWGDHPRFNYSGPPDAHKEVLADTVLRLVNRKMLPVEVLDQPVKPF